MAAIVTKEDVFNSVNDSSEMNSDTFLSPFLEAVKAEHTNGPVTAQAMSVKNDRADRCENAWSIASLCPPPPLPPPTVDSETIASETKPKVDRSFLRRAFASLVFESGDDQLPATLPHNENGNFVPIANDSAQLEALTKGKIAEEMRKRRILCVIVIGIIVSVGLAHNLFVLLLLFTNFFD
ncbi:hypothetical protein QR680_002931 [Steinernema hermaphroditum]|uniref:Uncharacterized protein n=1 Tax=Steinernema hermaphroditum TaxID=289476 RepID=A0AA39LIQ2_9BILA|nr:hypothetical protein QR680_002931 [Steinernema hermaphroditum]